ncbi:MAG: hypothetical protein DHS20C18_13120 [Saprospiraceae bacterium]|nr:MAG: hypothetical protein DHS20C18_13120 [Saprospiraceae bacterium]
MKLVMKKLILKFSLIILISPNYLYSQIPNGGFENWEIIDDYEKPVNWETNQDTNHIRFEKSNISFEGEYSMKIISSSLTAWTECNSLAQTSVKLDPYEGENRSLSFNLKSIPDTLNQTGNLFFILRVIFFESGNFESDYQLERYDIIEEFTFVEIPMSNPNVDSLEISIIGGAWNGPADGCHDRTITWIDNFMINTMLTSTIDNTINNINIFPNPSKGIIEVQSRAYQFNRFELINSQGIIVERGNIINSSIRTNSTGLFVLKLILENNNGIKFVSKKVLIK